MKPFQIEEVEGKRSAWIYPETDGEFEAVEGDPEPGRVALQVCYFTPKDKEALFHRMIAKGVMRRKIKGTAERFDLVPGRRIERDTMFAEALVLDWRGIIGPDKDAIPYSPEAMARVLASRQDVYDAVWKAVDEIGLFSSGNVAASSAT
jgi:hypothetical protein